MAGLSYVARRPLTVAGRTVQPGDVVPEAAGWRNVRAYVGNGALAVAVEVPDGAIEDAELKAQVATLSARVSALESFIAGTGAQDGELDTVDQGGVAIAGDQNAPQGDVITEPVDLSDWKLVDLQALAARASIAEPERFTKKVDAVAAILQATTPEELAVLVTANAGLT